jgi:hypothetical protein
MTQPLAAGLLAHWQNISAFVVCYTTKPIPHDTYQVDICLYPHQYQRVYWPASPASNGGSERDIDVLYVYVIPFNKFILSKLFVIELFAGLGRRK